MIKDFNLLDELKLYGSSHLSNDDVMVLSLLYAPLLKSASFTLYMSFFALLGDNLTSQSFKYQELLDLTDLKANEFYKARIRLEGLGLLATYKKENEYLLLLKNPLTAKQFLSDGILGMYLCSEIGENLFRKIQKQFTLPKLNKALYEEITASFDDVYTFTDEIDIKTPEYILDRKNNHGVLIKNHQFDFEVFKAMIPITFLDGKRITKNFKNFITNLAYAYGFNEHDMSELFNASIGKGSFEYSTCSKRAREKYALLHERSLPKMLERDTYQDEYEALLDNVSAKDLIEKTTGVACASSNDINKVFEIYEEYSFLNRSIVNLAIMYAINKTGGSLPAKNYITAILADWVKNNITSYEAAFEYVFKEKKKTKEKKKQPKDEPSWLNDYFANFNDKVDDL